VPTRSPGCARQRQNPQLGLWDAWQDVAALVGAVAVVAVVALAMIEVVVHLGSDLKLLFGF
jgi:hypothetical protein